MKQFITSALFLGALAISLPATAKNYFTIDPENGTEVETLSKIKLTANSGYIFDWAEFMVNNLKKVIVTKDGEDFCGITPLDGESENVMYLKLDTPATAAGEYGMTIPWGYIKGFNSSDEEQEMNEGRVTLFYTVTGNGSGGEVVETQYTLQPTFSYPDGSTFNVKEYFPNISVTNPGIMYKSGQALFSNSNGYAEFVRIAEFMESPMIFLGDCPLPTEDGKYYLNIPQGTFGDEDYINGLGGIANPDITLTYEITGTSTGEAAEAKLNYINILEPNGFSTILEDGLTAENFSEGTKLQFNTTNNLAVGYAMVVFTDRNALNPDEAILYTMESHARRTLEEDRGTFWQDNEIPFVEFASNLELLQGHTYDIHVELYDFETPPYSCTLLDEADYYIEGATPSYDYSSIRLTGYMPSERTVLNSPEEAVITLDFNGEINILNKSFFYAGRNQVSFSENDVVYSEDHQTATITFPVSLVESASGDLGVTLYITDMDGKSLFFDYDLGEDSHLNLEYACYLGSHDLTVTPEEGIVTEISEVEITCPGGPGGGTVLYADNYEADPITLRNLEGQIIGYFNTWTESQTGTTETGDPTTTGIKSHLVNEAGSEITVTTPGVYVLHIPAASINMGTQYTSESCKTTYVRWEIEGEIVNNTVYDFNPESQNITFNETKTVANVNLKFPEDADINPDVFYLIELRDDSGDTMEANISYDFDFDDFSIIIVNVNYEFQVNKVYNLVVPKGSIGDMTWAEYGADQYLRGRANPEFTVNIDTISTGIATITDAEIEGNVYNVQGMMVRRAGDNNTLPAGLYIINGKKVMVK